MAILEHADPDSGTLGVRAFVSTADNPPEWYAYCIFCNWHGHYPRERFTPETMDAYLRAHYVAAGHKAQALIAHDENGKLR